jgi:bis(5'-adenosyl)-triphosphatase
MAELSEESYLDMWSTVRKIQKVLCKEYFGDQTAFNVAVQDGRAAGQSVAHCHVHILPRREGDFTRNDEVYSALEEWAPRAELQVKAVLDVPEDAERRDRTRQEMADEAAAYQRILEGDGV